MSEERLYIGTSGWNYPSWRARFYRGVSQRQWLQHCASRFTGIEVNATFYRRMRPDILERWHDQTPQHFGFAVKGHRVVTHSQRLKDSSESVRETQKSLVPLGDKLKAVLWQLPPSLKQDLALLNDFSAVLSAWPQPRHVIEFRHGSWFDEHTLSTIERYGVATCISDSPRWPIWRAVASKLAYIRLHGHERLYASAYGEAGLTRWVEHIKRWLADGIVVHVYFDNDAEGAAPIDAQTLLDMMADTLR